MISNRRYKHTAAEELLQLPISFDKGIDNTAKLKNNTSAYDIKNLSVNPDGTLSLRKQLEYGFSFTHTVSDESIEFVKIFQLYNKDFLCIDTDGKWYIRQEQYDTWTNYTSMLYTTNTERTLTSAYTNISLSNCTFFNVTDATVIGNCAIPVATAGVDVTLYPTGTTSVWRFVKLYKKSSTWYFEIQDPETNTLSTADNGDLAFNANFALDNPYGLCDTYNVSAPAVKGILPYSIPESVQVHSGNSYKVLENKTSMSNAASFEVTTGLNDSARQNITDDETLYYTYTQSSEIKGAEEYNLTVNLTITALKDCPYRNIKFDNLTASCTWYSEDSDTDTTVTVNGSQYCGIKFQPPFTITISETGTIAKAPVITTKSSTVRGTFVTKTSVVDEVTSPNQYCISNVKIKNITETVKQDYKILQTYAPIEGNKVLLKAFCNFPEAPDLYSLDSGYYATWLYTKDGINWNNVFPHEMYQNDSWVDLQNVLVTMPSGEVECYKPLYVTNNDDIVTTDVTVNSAYEVVCRPDVLEIAAESNCQYMFKMVWLDKYTDESNNVHYEILNEVGRSIYTPIHSDVPQYLTNDIANAAQGKKLYHNTKVYNYGAQTTHILVSEPGEFISPLANIIDLAANADQTVTAVIPWNNYTVAATDTALYLITPAVIGYTTKTLNAAIGIPEFDANCCKAILNSIIFKSGPKVYMLYPNLYSGTDTIMNVAEISTPVQELMLELNADASWCTAVSTDSEYWLFWTYDDQCVTKCLVYNYVTKVWQHYEYPIRVVDVLVKDINTIQLYGQWVGTLDGAVDALSLYTLHLNTVQQPYDTPAQDVVYLGDLIPDGHSGYIQHVKRIPISFEIDTGQKTDTVSTTKQFVETKLVASTLHTKEDVFPMQLTISVNGEPKVITRDLTTDAGFRTNLENGDGLVLGAESKTAQANIRKVPKQLICRYSGKGTSVRHILTGSSVYDFRIHEMYVRYKYPKTKQ